MKDEEITIIFLALTIIVLGITLAITLQNATSLKIENQELKITLAITLQNATSLKIENQELNNRLNKMENCEWVNIAFVGSNISMYRNAELFIKNSNERGSLSYWTYECADNYYVDVGGNKWQ